MRFSALLMLALILPHNSHKTGLSNLSAPSASELAGRVNNIGNDFMLPDLTAQMHQDLKFLQKAFPALLEQFPDGEWVSWIIQTDYSGSLGFRLTDGVLILSILVEIADKVIYTVESVSRQEREFLTICDAVEFIGSVSRGLTPVADIRSLSINQKIWG